MVVVGRSRRGSARRTKLVIVLAICLLCVGSNVQGAYGQTDDNQKYCRKDGRVVVFLVDVTTPYDRLDKEAIVRMTNSIFSSVQGGDELIVHTISDSHAHSKRLVDRCIPVCTSSSAFGRFFKCNDGAIRTDFERVRTDVIGALRKRLLTFQEQKYSDIVRTIYNVTKEDRREGRGLVLYVYSDLIENSDYFASRYLFSYSLKRLIDGLKYYKLIANLRGANVYVAGVGRSGTEDRHALPISEYNKLIEFWAAYFRESGAKSVAIGQNLNE